MSRHRRIPARWLLPVAAVLLVLAAPAAAQPGPTQRALAAERYYSSYAPDSARTDAALATERYYSSYGTPASRPRPLSSVPVPAGHSGPTWTASILAGALAILAGAGVGVLAGRATVRPRQARV